MASTQSPYFISQQQEPPYSSNNTPQEQSFNFNSKVSPSILLIIVILAVIFFVSGLLHLLVRFLLRPGGPAARRRGGPDDDDDTESVSALQGQLQQLFHLHDAGVDQSFIDSLPVFQYTSITGSNSAKRPFDCAVCLCEFEPLDKLRLLPKCSHAFHTECIDTWLLSHSTCPLCRASLLFSAANANAAANAENCSPIVLVLESGSSNASTEITTTQEFPRNEEPTSLRELIVSEQRESIVTVKLGKFTSVDGGVGGGGGEGASSSASVSISVSNSVDSRRCFSMGSFAYVMDESSNLRVPIRMPSVKKSSKSTISSLPGPKAGMIARAAMSECDCESRREFEFNAGATPEVVQGLNNNSAEISKKESFSISKIWLRGKKEKDTNTTSSSSCSVECSRRAFSFRFQRSVNNGNGNGNGGVSGEDLKCKNGKFPRRTVSEIGVARWEREGVEMGFEEESQSCNSLDSQSNPPSFARKTLLWLMGRQQNKVVHSSFDPNNP